jgi:predicted RNA-binding Zn-ribbon protein involved in translation (DUF1610 family)
MAQFHEFRCPSCGTLVSVVSAREFGDANNLQLESAQCTGCGRTFSVNEIEEFLDALYR